MGKTKKLSVYRERKRKSDLSIKEKSKFYYEDEDRFIHNEDSRFLLRLAQLQLEDANKNKEYYF